MNHGMGADGRGPYGKKSAKDEINKNDPTLEKILESSMKLKTAKLFIGELREFDEEFFAPIMESSPCPSIHPLLHRQILLDVLADKPDKYHKHDISVDQAKEVFAKLDKVNRV